MNYIIDEPNYVASVYMNEPVALLVANKTNYSAKQSLIFIILPTNCQDAICFPVGTDHMPNAIPYGDCEYISEWCKDNNFELLKIYDNTADFTLTFGSTNNK